MWNVRCRVQEVGSRFRMWECRTGMQDVGMQDWDAGCTVQDVIQDAGRGCLVESTGCGVQDAALGCGMGVHDMGQGCRAGPRGAVRRTGGAAGGALPQQPPGTKPFPQSRQPEQGHLPRPHLLPGQGSVTLVTLASQPCVCPSCQRTLASRSPSPVALPAPARLPCPRTGLWPGGNNPRRFMGEAARASGADYTSSRSIGSQQPPAPRNQRLSHN